MRKSDKIEIRVSPIEKKFLKTLTYNRGISLSEYLLIVCAARYIVEYEHFNEEEAELWQKLPSCWN